MVIYAAPKPADRIPLIDPGPALDDSPDGMQAVAREIHIACRDTGFFHVRTHGIAPGLVNAQFEATRRLFALSDVQKLALHMHNSRRLFGLRTAAGEHLKEMLDRT